MRNLASLNANRIIPRPIEDFRELGINAAGLTISQAYGAWSWIIENAVKKAVAGSKADKAVHSIFLAAVNSGILLLSMLRGFDKMRHEMTFSSDGLVMPGDRDTVIDVIKRWAGENDGNDILISDPYFGPDDIDIIFSIASVAPRSPIKVLTGRRYLKKQVPSGNFEASFEDAWRNICDISPFDIEVAVVGVNSDGDHPIHDRWMVSEKNGLRLGTSANSIGHLKISEISPIDELVAFSRFSIISDFVSRKNKNWNGSKISIATFSIE